MTFYLDSSAIIKLAVIEPETKKLKTFLGDTPFASTEIAQVEVSRTLRRLDVDPSRGVEILRGMYFLQFNNSVAKIAALLDAKKLAALDAIHIATALSNDLTTFVTYDKRQAEAARASGLIVMTPGAD
jgi:predicted nucleic acid-binding protein